MTVIKDRVTRLSSQQLSKTHYLFFSSKSYSIYITHIQNSQSKIADCRVCRNKTILIDIIVEQHFEFTHNGLLDGWKLVCNRSQHASNGETVLVLVMYVVGATKGYWLLTPIDDHRESISSLHPLIQFKKENQFKQRATVISWFFYLEDERKPFCLPVIHDA